MPILKYKPTTEPIQSQNLPKIEPDNYKSIVYDDDNIPLHSLLSYVEGGSWIIKSYYSQIVSEHNDLREIDPGQSSIYQQYQCIKNLELRLTNALSSSYDTQNAISSASGTATIYPFLVPNVSDYFISNTFDNKDALFKITNVERVVYNRDSLYSIEFIMVGYTDQQTTLINNLISKTNREYYFYKDRLTNGLYPFVTTNESKLIKDSHLIRKDLIKYYFKTFFNRRYYTFCLPGQIKTIYDNYILNFLLKIIESTEAEEYNLIRELPEDYNFHLKEKTVLDILLERNELELGFINRHMTIINTKKMISPATTHGFYYNPIDYFVYPKNPDNSSIIENKPDILEGPDLDIQKTNNSLNTQLDYSELSFIKNNITYAIVSEIDFNSSYIFSDNFYNLNGDLSAIEILCKDYILKQSLSVDIINHILKNIKTFNKMEQFYYIPIMILLLTNLENEIYR